MAYEMVMPYHLHMPSYFLETFTEYPYVNSVDQVERITGFDFFYNLPDDIEEKVESNANLSDW